MKKRIIFMSAVIAAVGMVGVFGTASVTNAASAATSTHRTLRHDTRIREEAKLTQAVSDGVITKAQKQAFLKEVKTLRTANKTAVPKKNIKAELQAWASTNSFPLAKIFPHLAQ